MDCFTRFVGWGLAGLFGLAFASSAYAQQAPDGSVSPYVGPYPDAQAAKIACLTDYVRVTEGLATRGSSTCNPGSTNNPCVWNVQPAAAGRSCEVLYTTTVSGQTRYLYGCRVRANLVRIADPAAVVTQQSFDCTSNPSSDTVWTGGSFGTTQMAGYYAETDEGIGCQNAEPYSITIDPNAGSIGGGFLSVCSNGCAFTGKQSYVGTYPAGSLVVNYTPTGGSCDPEEEPDPEDNPPDPENPLDLDPEDGGVGETYDPGEGRDEDGHGRSSGGATCDAPPACTGEPIQCNILYQTWATRCEAQKLADGIVGDGEPGEPGTGDGPVVDAIDGLRDDLATGWNDGGVTDGAGLGELSGLLQTKQLNTNDLDNSGWGFPRSCPTWDDVSFPLGNGVFTIQLSSFRAHCTIFEWTGYLIVAFAAFWASMILLKGD